MGNDPPTLLTNLVVALFGSLSYTSPNAERKYLLPFSRFSSSVRAPNSDGTVPGMVVMAVVMMTDDDDGAMSTQLAVSYCFDVGTFE